MADQGRNIFIPGGPNGAGKTTAAKVLLPRQIHVDGFLNADEIAREISPDNVDSAAFAAGREMIEWMRGFVRNGQDFAFETTCSGKSYLRLLRGCRSDGWRISLIYLWVPSPEYSIARVAHRVRQGGHHIPDDVIRRVILRDYGICGISICRWRMMRQFTIIGIVRCASSRGGLRMLRSEWWMRNFGARSRG